MLREIKYQLLLLLLVTSSFHAFAGTLIFNDSTTTVETPEALSGVFDQMNYADVLEMTLRVDMEALTADKRNDTKHPALLSYIDENEVEQTWNTKIKLRGKFRRMNCSGTPPMKIYFYKEDLKKAGLAGFNDLKLVNYCTEDKDLAKELLMKEYLAYKMFNEITDESFRVQLLRITYVDTKSRNRIKQWAFVIEDTAQLRARLHAEKAQKYNSEDRRAKFEQAKINQVALFQYMIGNSDWSMNYEKNVKFLEKDNNVLAIPYDFDFSGLVNPPYGRLNPKYNVTTMLDRVYLGMPETIVHMEPTFELFKENKPELVALVQNNKHLSRKTKKEMLSYLDSFFENLTSEKIAAAVPTPVIKSETESVEDENPEKIQMGK